jgi:putative ABC transport system substrate-binding protein
MLDLRRRELMALLGGAAAAAWPLAARAQQSSIPVIGFLHPRSHADTIGARTAFQQGLREMGFVEGENLTVEYRFAEGQPSRLPALAADLVHRPVAVLAAGPRVAEAAKATTTTTPIVFLTGSDPVRAGLVASLNRPGGNLTGVSLLSPDLEAKRIGLHEWARRVRKHSNRSGLRKQTAQDRRSALLRLAPNETSRPPLRRFSTTGRAG